MSSNSIFTYRTKVDNWLYALTIGISGVPIVIGLIEGDASSIYIGIGVVVIITLLLYTLLRSISYVIDEEEELLTIKSLGMNDRIPIQQIQMIKKTNSILSSPAGSMDRMEIKAEGSYLPRIISPLRKREFVKNLLRINSEIEVDSKLMK